MLGGLPREDEVDRLVHDTVEPIGGGGNPCDVGRKVGRLGLERLDADVLVDDTHGLLEPVEVPAPEAPMLTTRPRPSALVRAQSCAARGSDDESGRVTVLITCDRVAVRLHGREDLREIRCHDAIDRVAEETAKSRSVLPRWCLAHDDL